MGRLYIEVDGLPQPVEDDDVITWGRWMEARRATGEIHIGDDTIDGVRVSTVFLGNDHNFYGGAPILWETLIFGGAFDNHGQRYHTRAQAERAHELFVRKLREGRCHHCDEVARAVRS